MMRLVTPSWMDTTAFVRVVLQEKIVQRISMIAWILKSALREIVLIKIAALSVNANPSFSVLNVEGWRVIVQKNHAGNKKSAYHET